MNLDDVLVWTDTHFGHRRILNFCQKTRPYASDPKNPTDDDIKAMDLAIIKAWNSKAKGKIIYFLGDFSFSRDNDYNQWIFNQLAGDKHLILGNHDHKKTRRLGWSSISDYKDLTIQDKLFVLHHYPISNWNKMVHGSYHLYGHVHGEYVPGKNTLRMLEPSIDNGFPTPVSLKDVVDLLQNRSISNPPNWG